MAGRPKKRAKKLAVVLARNTGALDPVRAAYIDFEGNKGRRPTLLGVLWPANSGQPEFHQFVMEDVFRTAAEAKACEYADFADAIGRVVGLAEDRDLDIVAWSEHELNMVKEFAPGWAGRFERRFRDAIPAAEEWLERERPEQLVARDAAGEGNSLDFYEQVTRYVVPSAFATGNAGKRLRHVRADLVRKGLDYSRCSPGNKRKWSNLLIYNEHDCRGMRHVELAQVPDVARAVAC